MRSSSSEKLIAVGIIALISTFVSASQCLGVKVLTEKEMEPFSIVQANVTHPGFNACIRKITDGEKIYILKQINAPALDQQFALINDCVASTIGYQIGVPVNEVFFVSYNVGNCLKQYPNRAATVHSYVPGTDLKNARPSFLSSYFTLQQTAMICSRWCGFSKEIIDSMSLHEALSTICALDTFVGNCDRSETNLFYDQQSNTFYGIDQAEAFKTALPQLAYEQIKELDRAGYFNSCSLSELKAVGVYKDVLQKLYEGVCPETVIQTMNELVGYLHSQAAQNNEIVERLRSQKQIIERNHQSSLQLIVLVDQILRKSKQFSAPEQPLSKKQYMHAIKRYNKNKLKLSRSLV